MNKIKLPPIRDFNDLIKLEIAATIRLLRNMVIGFPLVVIAKLLLGYFLY